MGGMVTASLDFVELPSEWARNVVAIIPGSDPVLKHEYVAIGAHNDHIGMRAAPVDKDSLKAFNDARNRMLLAKNMIALTPAELATIHVNMDSIRKIYPKARLDSISNGADDDGSGSMGVLEIAEAISGDEGEAEALDAVRLAHRRGGGARRLEVLHARIPRCRWTRSSRRSTST